MAPNPSDGKGTLRLIEAGTALYCYNCKSLLGRPPQIRLLTLPSDAEQSTNTGGGTLSFSESVEIVCTTCYITGVASAKVSAGRFNMSSVVVQTVDEIGETFENFTVAVLDYIGDFVEDVGDEVGDWAGDAVTLDFHDIDFDDIEMPTLDYDFSMDIPALPEVNLRFGFDALELYMELDTTLSLGSTYTYRLYTSNTPIGVGISDDLELGITFSVDLILTADASIDVSSGFHLKLDDGLAVDIALFGDEVSGIDL